MVRLASALLKIVFVPIGMVAWVAVQVIGEIGDSRAWAAFARWWGKPHGS